MVGDGDREIEEGEENIPGEEEDEEEEEEEEKEEDSEVSVLPRPAVDGMTNSF